MSNILAMSVGDYFVGKIFTYHVSNQEHQYVNTYEFRNNAISPDLADLTDLASKMADFHQPLLSTDGRIDRVVLSTYEAEEGGYDPLSFINIPSGVSGTRVNVGDLLPANIVLHVRRQVQTGREGKLHLRLMLNESDIIAPAGRVRLANQANIIGEVATALTESTFRDTTLSGSPYWAQMAMISTFGAPPVLAARLVQQLVAGQARVTKADHRYFDRA